LLLYREKLEKIESSVLKHVIHCPGRNTDTHNQLLELYPSINDHHILCIDTAQADLPYFSGSSHLTLCSKERYMLELHRFLLVPTAHELIKQVWESEFNHGRDWERRCRELASFNSKERGRILRNWTDTARYYCILAMSGWYYHYNKWMFVGEHTPVTPQYEDLYTWAQYNSQRTIDFQVRDIYSFRTTVMDNNSLIYFNFPYQYGSYGCRYLWTKSKYDSMLKELVELAQIGYKVCVSTPYRNRGRHLRHFTPSILPPELFQMHELKASEEKSEAFYVTTGL
jgi:hypothetical protein